MAALQPAEELDANGAEALVDCSTEWDRRLPRMVLRPVPLTGGTLSGEVRIQAREFNAE